MCFCLFECYLCPTRILNFFGYHTHSIWWAVIFHSVATCCLLPLHILSPMVTSRVAQGSEQCWACSLLCVVTDTSTRAYNTTCHAHSRHIYSLYISRVARAAQTPRAPTTTPPTSAFDHFHSAQGMNGPKCQVGGRGRGYVTWRLALGELKRLGGIGGKPPSFPTQKFH